jgi:two-component sensor histidine kinase
VQSAVSCCTGAHQEVIALKAGASIRRVNAVIDAATAYGAWFRGLRHRHLFAGLGFAIGMYILLLGGFCSEFFFASLLHDHNVPAALRVTVGQALYIVRHELPALPVLTLAINLAPATGYRRYAYLLAGVLAVWGFDVAFHYIDDNSFFFLNAPHLWLIFTIAAIVSACTNRNLARSATSKLLQSQIESAALDTEVKRARLQLLRAQIEPHFLFNTLATVQTLAHLDPAAAVQMIEHLMRYLSEALPKLRQEETSLAEELQLVDAYLRIHQIRMGARLSYELVVPDILAAERIPTMILLTLVENAVKHGINPTVEGGSICVSASREPAALVLKVSDSGQGLVATDGHGLGLANIRRRLMLLYGERAVLSLARAPSRGVTVSVSIPLLGAS